jgi:hypothetical protein
MPLRNSLIIFLISFNAWALTEIPAGVLELEGKILIEKEQVYLILNHGTLSATKLHLRGDVSTLKGQHQSNARMKVNIQKKLVSSEGEAELIKLEKFLHPADEPKAYRESEDFK